MDLEACLRRLPPRATTKGLFFQDILQQAERVTPGVDLCALAKIPSRRYLAFLDYPCADVMRLMVAGAGVIHPGRPVGEALRRFGHTVYDALFDTHAGRVVFGVLGVDIDAVMRRGPAGYRFSLGFGRVELEDLTAHHVRYHYRDIPVFLETYQVGVIEGALRRYRVPYQLRVAMRDVANATFDIRWG